MKMNINPGMLVGEVQKAFTEMFPFLKLEFYKYPSDVKWGKRMGVNLRIGDLQRSIIDSSIEIVPTMTVKELENNFRTIFTLTVQVFRNSGNTWLQTTMTDGWTLERQNEHGKEICESYKEQSPTTPADYDLSRDDLN